MKRSYLFVFAVLAACGDSGTSPTPDAPAAMPDAAATDFIPGCADVPQTGLDMFATAAELGPIVPGTLAGWDPDGRWFLTETRVGGVSSFHFARQGAQVVVDGDTQHPGTLDDDVLFQRTQLAFGEQTFTIAKRVSNRQPDGSFRADRVVCDGGNCRHCAAKLVRAERHDPKAADKLVLVGELGASWPPGYTFNVRVAGTLAYVIRIDGLYIVDVADPANPVQLGHYQRPGDGYSNDLKIVDAGAKRYVLIADTPVDVVDVTDPAAPQLAATITEEAHTLFTEARDGKTYAYFGNYDGTTPIWDVTNPAQPVRLGRYQSGASNVHDLSVAGGIAYLNAWEGGFQMVDFTTPASPALVGTWDPTTTGTSHSNWTTTAGGRKIALHGDESYGAHLAVVDIDPASPTFMQPFAEYKTRDWVSIHNIMAFGTKAYVTYYQDGVRVIDLADPAQPQLAGYYNTWDPQSDAATSQFFEGAVGLDVDLARKLIFVADSPRGLLILRDDTP